MKLPLVYLLAAAAVFAGCSVGPDYHQPPAVQSQPLPAAFSGTGPATNSPDWKVAEPSAQLPRGEWWKMFDRDVLDQLESLAATNNQSLAATVAQLEQARALVRVARADFFPQVSAQPSLVRERTSVNMPENGAAAGKPFTYNTFAAPLDLNWELDLFGRVRRETEGAQARFAAATDDLESARLALQAEVASDYFMLRALEAQHALVADSITAFRRSFELTQNRRKGGIASDLDVSEAETQVRVAEAELPALDLQRETLLHALAHLCGQPATGFEPAPEAPMTNDIPNLPPGLPSELLERRPDVAAAERQMCAANADVGVAKSAFFPRIFLTGAAGYESLNASTLFDWPSRMWALGPSVDLPLFTGGRNRAQLAAAHAAYDEKTADYRDTVLEAFQDVEDELSAQRLLAAQFDAQGAAVKAARQTLSISNNRYKAGLVTYLEVATAESVALSNEQIQVQLAGQRLVAEVALIKALGGGWRQ